MSFHTQTLLSGPSPNRLSSSSLSSATSLPETRVGELVRSFRGCLHDAGHDIDLERLLQACRCYETNMYEVGQYANGRDIAQNIQKVEQARSQAPAEHRHTLRSLLQYEQTCGVRQADGTLQNLSAAMGLLWLRRALSFQLRFNRSLVEQPEVPTVEAALEAYRVEGEPFHSWALQQVFKLGLRANTPSRSRALEEQGGGELFQGKLDEDQETMVLEQLKVLVEIWEPVSVEQ